MNKKLKHEFEYIRFLLKWLLISITAGITSSIILKSFRFLFTQLRILILMTNIPYPIITILGALIVGSTIYRIAPFSSGEGIPSYIKGLRKEKGYLSFKATFFKYWAALFTLSTFGNGGIVGPICRVNAGVMSYLGKTFAAMGFKKKDLPISAICGFSAALGSIFFSPIGAGIFSVEILQKNKIDYKNLFPAILASSTAVFVSRFFGWQPIFQIETKASYLDLGLIGWLVILSIILGFMGMTYTSFYSKITSLFNRANKEKLFFKVVIGSSVAALAWFVNPEIMGLSESFFKSLAESNFNSFYGSLSQNFPLVGVLLIVFIIKLMANSITVGSGMSAGFTGPSILLGMIMALVFIKILNITPLSANYFSFLAAGFAGMLAANMNVPIAAAVMTIEIFGLHYSFPAGLSAIIAFQVNRENTVYDLTFKGIINKSKDDSSNSELTQ